MENATEALKMAFAVFVFVIALSIVFNFMTRTKETADVVFFYNDKTNFRTQKVAIENEDGQKTVTMNEVISTIYRTKTEKVSVKVIDEADVEYIFDLDTSTPTATKTALQVLSEKILDFVETHINSTDEYLETFTEATYSGNYKTADDGTKLTITSGNSKIYITYTKKTST